MALTWQHLDEDVAQGRLERVQQTLTLIIRALCDLVPSRTDLHEKIRSDCEVANEHTQRNLVRWIQRFQAPLYDPKTERWLRKVPMPISEFLEEYLPHLQLVLRQAQEYRTSTKVASGR